MAANPIDIVTFMIRNTKRLLISVVGAALVLGGLAMLVLPGPGILVIALGFAVLGTEYTWAAIAFERTKRTAEQAGTIAKNSAFSAGRRLRRR